MSSNWKDRALHAANTAAAQEEEAERLRKAAEREQQVLAFGIALDDLLGEEVTVDDLEVTMDGVTFRWAYEPMGNRYHIVIQGTCPDCGALAWSTGVDSLERLGKLLHRFYPEGSHVKEHLKTPHMRNYQRVTPQRSE